MKKRKIILIATTILLFVINSFATVIINEITAAASDRVLNYSDNEYPKSGNNIQWINIDFNDSSWKSGDGPFGFGVGGLGTDLQTELQGKSETLYVRQKFIVSAADAAKTYQLRLQVDYDDGFIAFVNGKEIGRKNMGPKDAFGFHDQNAYNGHSSGTPENINYPDASSLLIEGTNVIAIQLHNKGTDNPMFISADLLINSSPEIQLVNHSDSWNYFIGYAEPSGGLFDLGPIISHTLHILWGDSSFNDSSWSSGPGGLGYGDGDDATTVNVQNIAYSIYIRQPFVLNSLITNSLTLTVDYDDAFIAYLNGYEIARRNMGSIGKFYYHNQPTPSDHDHEAGTPEIIPLPGANRFLVTGTNVLAVQTHNRLISSTDMTIKADLSADSFSNQFIYYTNIWKYMIGTNEPAAVPPPFPSEEINDDFSDWIELYNSSPTSINLKGWSLTDDNTKLDKWIFPDTTIPAGEYLVILCDGKNIISTTGSYLFLHTNFKLSKEGESLALYDNSSPRNFISGFPQEFPGQSFFHSYGWCEASNSYLYFSTSTPGEQNNDKTFQGVVATPIIDKPSGFYNGITASITSATRNAEIRYTIDGTEPTEISALYTGPLTFSINTALRIKAFKTGWIPSRTITRSYLLYANKAITNVPIVSIVSDWGKSIFKPNGVCSIVGGNSADTDPWYNLTPDDYNIPMHRGRPYERPVSVDFFNYGTDSWKQIDCGIRIAGSDYMRPRYRLQDLSGRWDSGPSTKKPQFNLFFRGDYGESTLKFPLIPNLNVTKFDSLRLRGGKNDWKNPFIVDEFARRCFINLGQIGSRGYIAWLFVNGELKAYFNPCERYDEHFFQEHYHSTNEWDIINNGTVIHGDVLNYAVVEGDDIAFKNLLNFFDNNNFENVNNYVTALKKLDMTNYVDYLILETYGGNWDWPNNNWFATREHSTNGIFRFYVWDAEGCFYNGNSIDVDSFNQHPSWQTGGGKGLNGEITPIANIWRKIKASQEFRLLFADRIQKHFFNNGCMTENKLVSEWNKLETVMKPMYLYFFGYALDVRTRTSWIPQRRHYIFQQFKNENLWPDTQAPYLNQHGGAITSGFEVLIHNINSAVTIYYTLDGSDPRQIGGAIHGSPYLSPVFLTKTTQIKARVLKSGEWSPICEAVFSVTGAQNIVVSEIMYHPPGGEDFEFIEIKNISGDNLDISDLSFVDGIYFSFAGSAVTELSNEAYVVVVKSNAVFASLYNTNDILIAGEYEGQLANSGERIEIKSSAGKSVATFIYNDDWYPETDGNGYSLVIETPYESTNLWNMMEGWHASYFVNGSPGKADVPEPVVLFGGLLLGLAFLRSR